MDQKENARRERPVSLVIARVWVKMQIFLSDGGIWGARNISGGLKQRLSAASSLHKARGCARSPSGVASAGSPEPPFPISDPLSPIPDPRSRSRPGRSEPPKPPQGAPSIPRSARAGGSRKRVRPCVRVCPYSRTSGGGRGDGCGAVRLNIAGTKDPCLPN